MPEAPPDDRPLIHKKGLRYNGFRIPWPFVGFLIAVGANAAVTYFKVEHVYPRQIADVEQRVSALGDRLDSRPNNVREITRLQTQVEGLQSQIEWHRNYTHGDGAR